MASSSSAVTTVVVLILELYQTTSQQLSCLRHYSAATGNSSGFSAAIARMSSVIFIEQYFGPHMLQKWALLNVSCGSVSS